METVGHIIPFFRNGTDYILNQYKYWFLGVLCRIYFLPDKGKIPHPSTTKLLAAYKSIHGCWITPHTTRYCLIA